MAVLCDLYVSTPDRAASYDERQAIPESERAQLTSLAFLEFSTLWAIIQGETWSDAHSDAFEQVLEADDGERTIHRFPAEFVAAAATLDASHAASATEKWAQTEELSCTAADIRPAVDDFCRVARVAHESGRSLYLWNCV